MTSGNIWGWIENHATDFSSIDNIKDTLKNDTKGRARAWLDSPNKTKTYEDKIQKKINEFNQITEEKEELKDFNASLQKADSIDDLQNFDPDKFEFEDTREKATEIWNAKSRIITQRNIKRTNEVINDIKSQTEIDALRNYPIDETINDVPQKDAINKRIKELQNQ